MKLYDFPKSGNCWKMRLLLGFLRCQAERLEHHQTLEQDHAASLR